MNMPTRLTKMHLNLVHGPHSYFIPLPIISISLLYMENANSFIFIIKFGVNPLIVLVT